MSVKISYVGPNGPDSPIYEFDQEDGFVVGADGVGFVNVLPEHAWFAVEGFTAMAEHERQPMLASVVSAVEEARDVGLADLSEEARNAFCDDVGILFGECLRSLGVSPADQSRLEPFTAVFVPGRPLSIGG
jgi:hypothetical protein